ncbi:DUF4382 domain-containing protein [Haloarchaeobius iranensis]|uniref:DUF4382 domain-containing protein n=1 Tax=Haloarchaeobius iranensis TaxID=996166 RepID=A0A1G9SBX3_9EURY|nr:DUF4382 domain-containing protein [Haloarchaeobius iranensis]SDM32974.1 protein of unknown function [Haloarchaeobius iranensis]
MSRSTALLAIALAALLVTAGCLGGVAGTGDGANTGDDADTGSDDTSVSFYVSDRPGAIDQFEHLNVTITSVGFHQADESGDETDEADEDADENETTAEPEDVNETATEDVNETISQTETNTTTDAPETDSEDSSDGTDTESDDESDSDDAESDGDGEATEPGSESEGWVTHEVDNRTVDLTELQGANASRLADFNVSAGEYDRVFVHVSEVQGTLENGEQVDVKLPSDKLQINKQFTAESGSNLSFVFDIMVHEAGNSGQYILRPVVSESGTGDQVEIDDVDADEREGERGPPENAGPGNDGESDDGESSDDDSDSAGTETELELAVDGQVRAGETVTLTVTGNDDAAVANATVSVDGETVGTTDADGTIELTVPDDAEELEVTATKDDAEAEQSWPVRGNGGQGRVAVTA